jgi:perosamine synthetase
MKQLAINGGTPVRTDPFPPYVTLGEEEKRAAIEVIESGNLSGFLGTWSPQSLGGPKVRQLENNWEEYFRVAHAVSMNSATSALYAAVGATGAGPGDEVIVSPYTMTASASAALVYGAIPVFADIDEETFCITPESVERCLSPYTKAIVVVDLLGHPAEMNGIMKIARAHSLLVVEDAAQAYGATYHDRAAGTLADIGVFSLNVHKTIQTGEGGVAVTDNPELAERLQLIRNHAEVVVGGKGTENLVNLVGQNYRMTEMEAALAIEQLKKLPRLHPPRVAAADFLTGRLSSLDGLTTPRVKEEIVHGYYRYALRVNEAKLGVSRDRIVAALKAEGIPMVGGYTRPLYLEPLYQKRIAFGKDGFPFTYSGYKGSVSYEKGICPVTERMYEHELMVTDVCHASITERDLEDVVKAFEKVWAHLSELSA